MAAKLIISLGACALLAGIGGVAAPQAVAAESENNRIARAAATANVQPEFRASLLECIKCY